MSGYSPIPDKNEGHHTEFHTHPTSGNRRPDSNIKNSELVQYIQRKPLDSDGKEYLINLVRSSNKETRESARNILSNLSEGDSLYVNQSGKFDQVLIRQSDGLFKNRIWLIIFLFVIFFVPAECSELNPKYTQYLQSETTTLIMLLLFAMILLYRLIKKEGLLADNIFVDALSFSGLSSPFTS